MSLRMPGDPSPPREDAYDILFRLYERGSLPVETVPDVLGVDQKDLEDVMRKTFPQVGEALQGDRAALVDRILEVVRPSCSRCGGTGNIGMVSSVRCPEC